MAGTALRVPRKHSASRIAEERKRDLIQAAIKDIAAHGYDAVTVATICEEAGFSRTDRALFLRQGRPAA